jgi:hypothetical protein
MRAGRGPAAPRTHDLVTSLYLWGPNRADVNRLAARAAEGIDPRYAWVEVLDPESGESRATVPERAIAAPVHAFAPPQGISGERMWMYLRKNGQLRDAQELQSFLKMSEPIQQAIAELLERDVPRVLVVANLERLQEFFCVEEPGPHPFVEWLNSREITLVASSTGGPLREGVHFEYLLTQPEATQNVNRPPLVAVCQRGDPDRSFLEQIFRPIEVVCVTGLSPSARPAPKLAAPASVS